MQDDHIRLYASFQMLHQSGQLLFPNCCHPTNQFGLKWCLHSTWDFIAIQSKCKNSPATVFSLCRMWRAKTKNRENLMPATNLVQGVCNSMPSQKNATKINIHPRDDEWGSRRDADHCQPKKTKSNANYSIAA
jgi:hypothetical protein